MKVIALGFFDGVHLGHGALLKTAKQRAQELGSTAAAMTFDAHPQQVLTGNPVPLLTLPEERARLMKAQYAMDEVIILPFDRELASLDWEQFVQRYLQDACHVVCGYDYRFGRGGQGTAQKLAEKCLELGKGCDIVEKVELDGEAVSSTRIRSLVQEGRIEEAGRCLGHPYAIAGTVIRGKQLGRTLGIPTANLAVPEGILPPKNGVYATKVHLPDGSVHIAVTNVGLRPTVEDGLGLMVEPWLLDFDGDLYGSELRVEFYHFIRPEQRFDGIDALKAEILRNADRTRVLLSE